MPSRTLPGAARIRRNTIAILAVCALGACGGEGAPTAPEAVPNVTGDWTGTAQDTYDNTQTVNLTLTQEGARLSGEIYSMIFRTLVSFPVTGTVDADGNVTLQVLAAYRGGCFDVTVNVSVSNSRRRLSGTYVVDRMADRCGRRLGGDPRKAFNVSR